MGVDPFWFPKISEVVRATSTLLEDSIQTGIYLKNLTEKNHIRIRLKIKTIKFLCFGPFWLPLNFFISANIRAR
jgi:hypothetical protein